MRKERKHYTAEEKVAILRRHLLDQVPVSDLCEELGLQPTVFYRWQKELFENGAAAFQSTELLTARWAGGPLKPGFGLSGDVHTSQTWANEQTRLSSCHGD